MFVYTQDSQRYPTQHTKLDRHRLFGFSQHAIQLTHCEFSKHTRRVTSLRHYIVNHTQKHFGGTYKPNLCYINIHSYTVSRIRGSASLIDTIDI